MVPYRIVRPTAAHLPVLCELGKVTFAETFTGLAYYTEAIVAGYVETAFAPDVVARDLVDPKVHFYLLEAAGTVVGYAKLVEKQPTDCIADLNAIYLERIYFTKKSQGRGFGKALMAEVFREARALGYPHLWLSVWEYNVDAVAFYRRLGFQHAGEWDWRFESGGVTYVDRDWVFILDVASGLRATTSRASQQHS